MKRGYVHSRLLSEAPPLNWRMIRQTARTFYTGCPGPDHYFVDNERHFIYCGIPKNACSTIKIWFLENLGVSLKDRVAGEPHELASRFSLRRYKPAEARRLMRTYFLFTFVRNPWNRIASGYINKFVQAHGDSENPNLPLNQCNKEAIERYWMRCHGQLSYDTSRMVHQTVNAEKKPTSSQIDYDRGLTFREFVEHLCMEVDRDLNVHWRSQEWFQKGVKFDFVGRVENLTEDMETLEKRLGISGKIGYANRSARAKENEKNPLRMTDVPSGEMRDQNYIPTHDNLWTNELIQKVFVRYRKDIRKYGYSGDAPRAYFER